MDRDGASLESAPEFTWRRLVVTLLASAAILGVGSFVVRAFPVSGYDAGYSAVMVRGETAVRESVDAAGGVTTPLCDDLHGEIDRQPGEPHYDRRSFLDGCHTAVEELYGHPVPGDAG